MGIIVNVVQPDSHPELIPYCLLMMSLICMECFFTSFHQGSMRKKIFEPVMGQFFEVHTRIYESAPQDSGHPDTGSGLYSSKLTYRNWYDFNNAYRVHMNFVEQLPVILPLILLASLKTPLITLFLSVTYFVLRLLYTWGYVKGGPEMRKFGGIPMSFTKLGLLILAGYTVYSYAKVHYHL
eukprot:403346034